MKKALPIIAILGLALSGIGTVAALNANPKEAKAGTGPVSASSLPTTIDLKDNTDAEIRSYYSSLNSLPESERQGTNLLKNLRSIIHDLTYFSYDACWKIYEITDREWTLSPASETTYGTYNASTNKITNYSYGSSASNSKNNPYLHDLYKNRDANGVTVEAARIRAWENHGTLAGGTDREHVWCQSRGFKASSGAKGPAGTDVHHLMAGDSRVNQTTHNNNPYGFIDGSKSYEDASKYLSFIAGNIKGYPLNPHSQDQADTVFEPQDSDKGDIARACFYMAACYNNYSGNETISQYDPNLIMVDYASSNGSAEESSATHPVAMGILSDMLEWNKIDPVDEFEIHRNNLIYNNYQHNRNPFVDFPQWADYIWGEPDKVGTPTGSADPKTNSINAKAEDDPISSSSEEPSISSSDEPLPSSSETSSPSEEPSSEPTPSSSDSDLPSETSSDFIEPELTLSTTELTLKVGEEIEVSGGTSDGTEIVWTNSDPTIVSLEEKPQIGDSQQIVLKGLKKGKATITASAEFPYAGTSIAKYIDVKVVEEEAPVASSTPASSSSAPASDSSFNPGRDIMNLFGCNSSISAFGIGGIAIIGAIASFVLFKKKKD